MILVTGAGGFIGRQVCSLLARAGKAVLAVDRSFPEPVACPTLCGDLTDASCLRALFEHQPIEQVAHLASLLNTASRTDPEAALEVNMRASARLLERCAERAGVRFVYASSASAYGSKRYEEHGPVSESVPASPSDIYGLSKRFVELIGEDRRRSGLEFVSLRIPIVVGAGARSSASRWRSDLFHAAERATPIRIPFDPDELLPLIHVEDVAALICVLLDAPAVPSAVYNPPAESWTGRRLCAEVARFVPGIELEFGTARVDGIPQVLDSRRFAETFAFTPLPIASHLQRALAP